MINVGGWGAYVNGMQSFSRGRSARLELAEAQEQRRHGFADQRNAGGLHRESRCNVHGVSQWAVPRNAARAETAALGREAEVAMALKIEESEREAAAIKIQALMRGKQ